MNKEQSLILKGIAIIMMLFIHLDLNKCTIFPIELELWNRLRYLWVPVPLFLLAGGYGLQIVKNQGDSRGGVRILRLLLSYWLVTIIAVFLMNVVYPGELDFSLMKIMYNITTYHTSWNSYCWFVFPYSVLSLSCGYIFRWTKKYNPWLIVLISFMISTICLYLYSRLGVQFSTTSPTVYNILCFSMLFCFMFGAISARESWMDKLRGLNLMNKKFFLLIIVLIIVGKISIQTTSLDGIFAIVIMSVVAMGYLDNYKISRVLKFLGLHSMNIWLVHYWVSRFASDIIFIIPNPVVAFCLWLALCIPVAIILKYIEDKIMYFLSSIKRI